MDLCPICSAMTQKIYAESELCVVVRIDDQIVAALKKHGGPVSHDEFAMIFDLLQNNVDRHRGTISEYTAAVGHVGLCFVSSSVASKSESRTRSEDV
jgi:hypothetical protein